MKTATAIKFCRNYTKLKNDFFLTVRWPDTEYEMGKVLPVLIKGVSQPYQGRVCFAIMTMLSSLIRLDFTSYDADCTPNEYRGLMHRFYSRKPDWKWDDSLVQIIGIKKVG